MSTSRVNAIKPIFSGLERAKEDYSLPKKMPIRFVRAAAQLPRTFSNKKRRRLSTKVSETLASYRQVSDGQVNIERTNTEGDAFFQQTNTQQSLKNNGDLQPSTQPTTSHFVNNYSANNNAVNNPENHQKKRKPFVTPFGAIITPLIAENEYLPDETFASNALPLSEGAFLYQDIVQKVANDFKVAIGLKQPNGAGQRLLATNYALPAHFSIMANEIGPAAGFFTEDAIYATVQIQALQYQRHIKRLLSEDVGVTPLRLSVEMLKNAIEFGAMKRITRERFAVIYQGGMHLFHIAAPEYIVRNITTNQQVNVLATAAGEPLTEAYQVTSILPHKNTPAEIAADNGKLNAAVIQALNNIVKKQQDLAEDIFVLSERVSSRRQFFFLPQHCALQLINRISCQHFYRALEKGGYRL